MQAGQLIGCRSEYNPVDVQCHLALGNMQAQILGTVVVSPHKYDGVTYPTSKRRQCIALA